MERVIEVVLTCPRCKGEITFECEPPDYDVGLMGYACGMAAPEFRDCQCAFTEQEQEALEYRASEQASEPREPV